jgi:hypothetical protein
MQQEMDKDQNSDHVKTLHYGISHLGHPRLPSPDLPGGLVEPCLDIPEEKIGLILRELLT